MSRWKWALLLSELALFALILIHPQVALPAFTFHGGTAPVFAKFRLSSPPLSSHLVLPLVGIHLPVQTPQLQPEAGRVAKADRGTIRLTLLCILIC
jgi:hypothetical protein